MKGLSSRQTLPSNNRSRWRLDKNLSTLNRRPKMKNGTCLCCSNKRNLWNSFLKRHLMPVLSGLLSFKLLIFAIVWALVALSWFVWLKFLTVHKHFFYMLTKSKVDLSCLLLLSTNSRFLINFKEDRVSLRFNRHRTLLKSTSLLNLASVGVQKFFMSVALELISKIYFGSAGVKSTETVFSLTCWNLDRMKSPSTIYGEEVPSIRT